MPAVSFRLCLPLLAALALAAGCRTAPPPAVPLAGTAWTLASLVEGGAEQDAIPPDEVVFDADGRGVRVASCNTCIGLYTVGDRTLELTRLGCTKRACNAEFELDRYLAGRSRWRLDGDRLVLTVDDPLNSIDAVLTFQRVTD